MGAKGPLPVYMYVCVSACIKILQITTPDSPILQTQSRWGVGSWLREARAKKGVGALIQTSQSKEEQVKKKKKDTETVGVS